MACGFSTESCLAEVTEKLFPATGLQVYDFVPALIPAYKISGSTDLWAA
jgi:hypothetical protein